MRRLFLEKAGPMLGVAEAHPLYSPTDESSNKNIQRESYALSPKGKEGCWVFDFCLEILGVQDGPAGC